VLATLIAYEPVRHNDFVNYDDDRYIVENSNVNGGLTQQSIIWAFTKSSKVDYWIPLTWISHMLDCQIFGPNPVGHHFVNVFLHITNALLLFWILNSITALIWPSAFVAAVFALHPLQVESVAWAAERKTVLSGLFWFFTMAVYIWYAKRPGIGRYVLLFGIYALSIMTKPVAVTLPFVLLLLDYWPLERFTAEHPSTSSGQAAETAEKKNKISSAWSLRPSAVKPAGWLIIEKIPLLALTGILGMTTVIAQQLVKIPLSYRIVNMFVSYIKYIGKIVWPNGLAVIYPYPHMNLFNTTVIICTLIFTLITALIICTGLRKKYAATGWLWFVGTLVPMIGLVQVGAQGMADRYMYISMPGLLIIVAWAVKDFVGNRPGLKVITAISATIAISVLLILTRTQVKHWRNSSTLFEQALKVTKKNFVAENSYGSALFSEGRFKEAELHYRNALAINPNFATARIGLSNALIKSGKFDEAVVCYEKLIKQGQGSAEIYYALATILKVQKKYDEAIKFYKNVSATDHNYSEARKQILSIFVETGRFKDAIEQLENGLPGEPNKAENYETLGSLYYQTGNYEQAIQSWSKAVNLKPDNTNALNSLAWLLATTGEVSAENTNKAVKLAERACEMTGYKNAGMLDTLAAAYAAAGKFEDAVNTANQAIKIAETGGQQTVADDIRKRTKLYQAGQRYRQ